MATRRRGCTEVGCRVCGVGVFAAIWADLMTMGVAGRAGRYEPSGDPSDPRKDN